MVKDNAFSLSIYKYRWISQLPQLHKNNDIKNMTHIANSTRSSTYYIIKSITLKCINSSHQNK